MGLADVRPEILFGGGLVVGLGAGYAAGRFILEKKYRNLADMEILSVKAKYKVQLPQQPAPTIQEALEQVRQEEVKDLVERVVQLDYTQAITDREPEKSVQETHNIFRDDNLRLGVDEGAPYIIGDNDYMTNPDEWEQVVYTWYEGGETLADEADVIITDIEATVGMANLMKFGDPGVDPNTMFVANPRTRTLYEIARLEGTYEEIVLGYRSGDPDDGPTIRKMRDDRDS